MEEGEDERREAAIAAVPSLQPNFKSTSVTQDQLNKLKELHRRRLHIKARSKIQKNLKGNSRSAANNRGKELAKDDKYEDTSVVIEDSGVFTRNGNTKDISSLQQDNTSKLKKRQKLHWGLDTKERWERKANM